MTIITIDGNIGAGKTSILHYLHKYKGYQIDLEPVDKWKLFLDNIYINKKDYFNFHIRVWLDRAWIQEKDNKSTIFMERSPFFIRNTFNLNDFNINNINQEEFNVINEMYNKTDNIWKSNMYIYLKINPEKCLNRIKERGRENEMNITLEYLKNIHELHEKAYKKAIKKKLNIKIIDGNDKSVSEIVDEIISLIK